MVNLPRRKFCIRILVDNFKVSKGAKIRNRYNQVPHLTQGTDGKMTNSQLGTTNESQEVSPFPAGEHKAHISRRTQRHSKHKADQNMRDPQKKYRLGTVSKIYYWRALTGLTAQVASFKRYLHSERWGVYL